MPAHFVADLLEIDGWEVVFVGTGVPAPAVLAAVAEPKPAVVGLSATQGLAEENLQRLCVEHLRDGDCTVTIVDVRKDFQIALDHNIVMTPTLLVEGPRGRATMLGNLSDIARIMPTFSSKS